VGIGRTLVGRANPFTRGGTVGPAQVWIEVTDHTRVGHLVTVAAFVSKISASSYVGK